MGISEKWTITLKNSISGNGIVPTIDPFNDSVFYIADGWGSAYNSMKFRKLLVETGEELAAAPIKNMTRCIHINESHVFAVSEKRILQLARNDLSIVRIYRENIPKYASYINSDDNDILLLMGRNGGCFYRFDLQTGKNTKKRLSSCCGIIRTGINVFLIFSTHGGVFKYYLDCDKLEKIIKTEPFLNCCIDKSNNLYVHRGKLIGKTNDTTGYFQPSSKLLFYPLLSETNMEEIDTGVIFEGLQLSDDGKLLYLYKDSFLWLYSLDKRKVVDTFTFPTHSYTFGGRTKILNIFDKKRLVITNEYNIVLNGTRKDILTCWAI
jgi:hypothetical protein